MQSDELKKHFADIKPFWPALAAAIGFQIIVLKTDIRLLHLFLPMSLLGFIGCMLAQAPWQIFVFGFALQPLFISFPLGFTHLNAGDLILLTAYLYQYMRGEAFILRVSSPKVIHLLVLAVLLLLLGTYFNAAKFGKYWITIHVNTLQFLIKGYALFFVLGEAKNQNAIKNLYQLFMAITLIYICVFSYNVMTAKSVFSRIYINPNLISSLVDLLLPFSFFYLLEKGKPLNAKLQHSAVLMLFLLFYVLGEVRGSIVALPFVLALPVLVSIKRVYLVGLLIFFVFLGVGFASEILSKIQSLFTSDLSLFMRIFIWKSAVSMLQDNLLWGVGLDIYKFLKFDYFFPRFWDPTEVKSSHNLFLEMMVSFGIVGFSLFATATLIVMGKLYSVLNRNKVPQGQRHIYLGLMGAFTMLSLHGLIDSFLFFNVWLLCISCMFGFALHMLHKTNLSEKPTSN